MTWIVMFFFNLIYLWDEYHCLEPPVLYSTVTVDKKTFEEDNTIKVPLLQGGNISVVVFESKSYMRYAGFYTGQMRLAGSNEPLSTGTGPKLTIDDNKHKLTVDFTRPIQDHDRKKNWTFVITLDPNGRCKEMEGKIECRAINNKMYSILKYVVTFEENDLIYYTKDIDVIVNNKILKVTRMSGAVPTNMTFTYYYRYDQPNVYRIECKYSGKEAFEGKWSDINRQSKKKQKVLGRDANLSDADVNNRIKQFNCTYNYRKEKHIDIIKTVNIILQYAPVTELLYVKNNGQPLENHTAVKSSDEAALRYEIYYNEHQNINLTCGSKNMETCDMDNCSIILYEPGYKSLSPTITKNKGPIEKTIQLSKEHNGALINCTYRDNVYGSINTTIEVQFLLRGQIIKETDIIFKMNGNDIDNNEFKYDEEGSISIDCGVKKVQVTFTDPPMDLILYRNDVKVNTTTLKRVTKNGQYFIPSNILKATFNLMDNDNYTCNGIEKLEKGQPQVIFSKSIIIKKQEESTVSDRSDQNGTQPKGIRSASNKSIPNAPQPIGLRPDHWTFYIALPCALAAIIVIIICIIKVARKKPRDTEQLVQAEHENLHDYPPPNFPQSATLEETYCRPADVKHTEPTYSQPYVPQTVEELYSKPIPKTRKPNSLYASLEFENAYASVKPKSERKKTTEPTYAEVGKSLNVEPTYASVNECGNGPDNYANVFDTGRYVNSKEGAEYVEPSYCEVSKIKK